MLGQKPAERGFSGRPLRQAVGTFGERVGKLGEAPGGQRIDIGDGGDDVELVRAVARNHGGLEGRLSVEPLGGEEIAARLRLALQPVGKAALVDQVNRMGLLAAVGNEQRSEVGHPPRLSEARGLPQAR